MTTKKYEMPDTLPKTLEEANDKLKRTTVSYMKLAMKTLSEEDKDQRLEQLFDILELAERILFVVTGTHEKINLVFQLAHLVDNWRNHDTSN